MKSSPKHKPEPVQKGNPHGLVQRQHILPRRSIQRFYGVDQKIAVALLGPKPQRLRVTGDHEIFCAKRVWDQRAESGYMAQIEQQFQFLADAILLQGDGSLPVEHDVATAFFALWRVRAHYAATPVSAVLAKGVTPDVGLTKDKKERLERNHYLFIDENGMMGSRQLTGLHIQRAIDDIQFHLQGTRWSVVHARPDAGEFLVPDNPEALFIPVSPTVALLGNTDIRHADTGIMKYINQFSRAVSKRFVFAREFAKCIT